MWRPCTSNAQCAYSNSALYETDISPRFVAILNVINFTMNFIPWNFLKRKLESEESRCSFASSSFASSFMPVGSNNRKPLWSRDGFCRPERLLIPVACEV